MRPPDGTVIGVDARAACEEIAGRGRYVRELLRALAARNDDVEYRLYARRRWDEPLGDRFSWRLPAARGPAWHLAAARAADRETDVLLCAQSYLPALLTRRTRSVLVVHDAHALDRATRPRLRSAAVERLTLPSAVRRAAAIVAVSRATAEALARAVPAATERTTVAPLGVADAVRVPGETGLPAGLEPGFVLAVGTIEPRKNLARLAAAFALLPDDLQRRHPLVVAGRRGWRARASERALDRLGDRCRRLGPVGDAQLAALYRACAALAYPSLGEGFGLPVAEALAAGAPVLCSDRPSLPEVGADAALYVDPLDPAAIARVLARVLTDRELAAELARRGPERARAFSWSATAAGVLDALGRAAAADPAQRR